MLVVKQKLLLCFFSTQLNQFFFFFLMAFNISFYWNYLVSIFCWSVFQERYVRFFVVVVVVFSCSNTFMNNQGPFLHRHVKVQIYKITFGCVTF